MHAAIVPLPTPSAPAFNPGSWLISEAARCWRIARDEGKSAQHSLYQLLKPLELGVLAPVFDSLMSLCEAALGRHIQTGNTAAASADECLLLGLLDGSKSRRACINCEAGAASALDCAICSTRIMLALATGDPERQMIR